MQEPLSKELIDKLKYYVYLYSDPETGEIFYIGKGKGNRVYSHLTDLSDSEKTRRIKLIRDRGQYPKIEILIHGIEDEDSALKIEAAVIDLLGKEVLTNQVRGWRSSLYGRVELKQLVSYYTKEAVEITEKAILIRINQKFRYGMSEIELYDTTRGIWVVGENRTKAEYAFAIFDGIIQQVYKIAHWFPAGTTLSTRDDTDDPNRWEFVGKIAEHPILEKYVGKSVEHYFPRNAQNPIAYRNTKK